METEKLWQLYDPDMPSFLQAAAQTALVQRLKNVGMNCGCEYTSFPRFREQAKYTRFAHSVGVGLIVWHFTHDKAQALAGLAHDVATPVFAHVIDFLRGDHLSQETTEAGTAAMIAASEEWQEMLHRNGLTIFDVEDYHRYPIADNDAPRLSADRLEYSLGNMLHYGIRSFDDVARYYRELTVINNEAGQEELAFCRGETALDFARGCLACSEIYVSDEDRYAMQALAELVGQSIEQGVLAEKDLYRTEPEIIAKWEASPVFLRYWRQFCTLCTIETCREKPEGPGWRQIPAKKRMIDPLIVEQGRASAVFPDFAQALTEFRGQRQELWLRGMSDTGNHTTVSLEFLQ